MKQEQHDIYVAMISGKTPVPVGVLSFIEGTRSNGDKITGAARFTYLNSYEGPPLDPAHLNYKKDGKRTFDMPRELRSTGLFRIFSDNLPGAWGRRLMAKEDPETLKMNDAQLVAHLATKGRTSGALFLYKKSPSDENPLRKLQEVDGVRIKSLIELGKMAANFTKAEVDAATIHGGARAKVAYHDVNGEVGLKSKHYIVKFNASLDPCNFAAVEKSMMDLARQAGINAARSLVVAVKDPEGKVIDHMYLTERYDRFTNDDGVEYRCHKASLLSLVDPKKVPAQDAGDYSDIFEAIRACSSSPEADAEMMFRRMLFNIGINNTDDHLLNHEMLIGQDASGNTICRLAPAFDLMPTAAPHSHVTKIAGHDNGVLSDEFVVMTAKKLGVDQAKALAARNEVLSALKNWEVVLKQNQGGANELQFVDKALSISGTRAQRSMLLPSGMANPVAEMLRSKRVDFTPPILGGLSTLGLAGASSVASANAAHGVHQVVLPADGTEPKQGGTRMPRPD